MFLWMTWAEDLNVYCLWMTLKWEMLTPLRRDHDKLEGWGITDHLKFNRKKQWILQSPICVQTGAKRLKPCRKGSKGSSWWQAECEPAAWLAARRANHTVLGCIKPSTASWVAEGAVLLCWAAASSRALSADWDATKWEYRCKTIRERPKENYEDWWSEGQDVWGADEVP